jgi:hypothetical protein
MLLLRNSQAQCAYTNVKARNHTMVMVKKSVTSSGAPTLDILAARLKVLEAELTLEEVEVKPEKGNAFIAEPNLNLKLEVVKNLVEPGVDEGVKFYDRFKLKKDDDGDWVFAKYSKLGNLIQVRYGPEWFENPNAEFDEADFEGFEFVAQIEPKTDPKGNPLAGSTVNWKGMRRAGGFDDQDVGEKQSRGADGKEEDDFDDIPF